MAFTIRPKADTTATAADHAEIVWRSMGQKNLVLSGFEVTDNGGLEVSIAAGEAVIYGYHVSSDAAATLTITNNSTQYVHLTNSGALSESTSSDLGELRVTLAKVVTSGGAISSITHEVDTLDGDAGVLYRVKPSDTTRNSTTTLSADPILDGPPMDPGQRYRVEAFLTVNSGATPDFKVALSGTNMSGRFNVIGPSGTAGANVSLGTGVSVTTDGTDQLVIVDGVVFTETTSNDFKIEWAQNTSDAGDTTVKADSYWICSRLEL